MADWASMLAHTLLRKACVSYGNWSLEDAAEARRLLADDPALAEVDLHTAATVGDVDAARRWIAADPAAVQRKGGPHDWEPLLYACYSRLDSPAHSTLAVARLLLEAGADPDSGFLWSGDHVPPFTALTGAFGEGENDANQPPHRERDALARLLLDAGADANDGQTLYNRHFKPADDHLELLFAYGLGKDRRGPWGARLGSRLESPAALLVEEMWCAAKKNFVARARLLVEHGAAVDVPGRRDGKTPWEKATLAGNEELAAYLVAHGARPRPLTEDERFVAACLAGRAADARALLSVRDRLGPVRRLALVDRAVEVSRPEAVRLMAGLGFELSLPAHATPLHQAAWKGDVAMARLLVELGADPTVREPSYQATPLGWAEHNRQSEVAAFLRGVSPQKSGSASRCAAAMLRSYQLKR